MPTVQSRWNTQRMGRCIGALESLIYGDSPGTNYFLVRPILKTLTLQNCDGAEIQQTPKDVGSAEGLEAAGIIALCRSGEHRDLL